MTDSEKIADLEQRLKKFEDFFVFGKSSDGMIDYVKTQGRLGIQTEYWCKQPWGKGAALSVGTTSDRFGAYVEVEEAQADHPAVAVYAAVPCPNGQQKNIAVVAVAANSAVLNVALHADGQGIEVGPSQPAAYIGKDGQYQQLWP